jgi:F1F0 ATPase subunit 2
MNEQSGFILAYFCGLGLGTIFFIGLWKSVKQLESSKVSTFWLIFGPISRISITLLGFYFVGTLYPDGRIIRILLSLLGYITARFIIIRVVNYITLKRSHAS